MKRLCLFTFLLVWVAAVLGDDVEFVSPGPSVSNSNPSVSNAVHPVGSNFHVAWSGANSSRAVSVVLFQYDGTNLVYPFEYVLQSTTGETSTDWTVATSQNLSFSNLFLFNLFYAGETSPVAVSETFNITDDSSSSTTTSSAMSSSATSIPNGAISTFFITSTTTGAGASATFPVATTATTGTASDQSGGVSTGTKIGIGVAVPVVALAGIAVGYFLFRRRAKKQQQQQQQQQGVVVPALPDAAGQSSVPIEHWQKPADLGSAGQVTPSERPLYEAPGNERPIYARPTMYEMDGRSGPTMMHELSGCDAARY